MITSGVRAICLDLDDTLVDARGAWHAGFAEVTAELWSEVPALAALGTPAEVYDGPIRTLITAAHARRSNSEWSYELMYGAFREFFGAHAGLGASEADHLTLAYRRAWPRHVSCFPEVERVLAELSPRYPLGVITNGLIEDQRLKLESMAIARYFQVCVISEEVGVTKPDPAIFHRALTALGEDPSATVYVGDNPAHDVAGARGVGMPAIWLNRSGNRFLSTPGTEADAEIQDLDQLVRLLD